MLLNLLPVISAPSYDLPSAEGIKHVGLLEKMTTETVALRGTEVGIINQDQSIRTSQQLGNVA
jgi:hypothetical protein